MLNNLIQYYNEYLVGAATLWLFATTWKNRKDLNAMFRKIRKINKHLGIKEDDDHKSAK
jgi:hypothetical protein